MDALIDLFATAQEGLFETVFQPLAFAWGLAGRLENVYDATGWLLIGLLQIAVMLAVIGPLQRWHPAEVITDTSAVQTDVLYTLIHRLGLFQLVLFFSIDPLMDELMGHLRTLGFGTFHLDDIWPGVTDGPIMSFVLYLVLFAMALLLIH